MRTNNENGQDTVERMSSSCGLSLLKYLASSARVSWLGGIPPDALSLAGDPVQCSRLLHTPRPVRRRSDDPKAIPSCHGWTYRLRVDRTPRRLRRYRQPEQAYDRHDDSAQGTLRTLYAKSRNQAHCQRGQEITAPVISWSPTIAALYPLPRYRWPDRFRSRRGCPSSRCDPPTASDPPTTSYRFLTHS